VVQFECGTRILRVIHGRDARATSPNRIATKLTVCGSTNAAQNLLSKLRASRRAGIFQLTASI